MLSVPVSNKYFFTFSLNACDKVKFFFEIFHTYCSEDDLTARLSIYHKQTTKNPSQFI